MTTPITGYRGTRVGTQNLERVTVWSGFSTRLPDAVGGLLRDRTWVLENKETGVFCEDPRLLIQDPP